MNIMTLGLSPYLYLSDGRIHGMIIEHLFRKGYSVASIGRGYDVSYFLPEKDENGNLVYYYKFDNYKVPIVPFNVTEDPGVGIYEILKIFHPEMLVTIGDYNDYLYMKAVKMFYEKPLKWLAICTNYSYPINEKNVELLDDMDGILCTSEFSFNLLSKLFKRDEISLSHVGCDRPSSVVNGRDPDKFRVMMSSKNLQADNLPMMMEAIRDIREEVPNLELYLHTNVYDQGDFDLHLLKDRFDPEGEFIYFPEKYVSMNDGYSEEEFLRELSRSDIFASLSVNSPTGLSIFDAISAGCVPLMSKVGSHVDIARHLGEISPEFERNDFLVPCIEVMLRGEVYANICKPDSLREKLLILLSKIKKGGHKRFSQEFVNGYSRTNFLDDVTNMVEAIRNVNPTICVEPV